MALPKPRIRSVLIAISMLLGVGAVTSCTAYEQDIFRSLAPHEQAAVVHELQLRTASTSSPVGGGDCHSAVDAVWPAGMQAWAHKIVNRESGGDTTSKNRSSSASGCFQIIQGTWNSNAADGCPWSTRFDAMCNARTALVLYNNAGTSPWRLTNY